jgi:hypothetical protein
MYFFKQYKALKILNSLFYEKKVKKKRIENKNVDFNFMRWENLLIDF